MIRLQLAAGSPGLRSLLQLQKHVTTFFVIVEVMNIIDDQDRRATVRFTVMQSHLLKLIKGYGNMSDRPFHGNIESYPSQYPVRDRLWCEDCSITNAHAIVDERTFSRVSPLEQRGLRVFVILVVQGLAEPQPENFQIGMRITDGDAFGLDGCHSIENHCRFPCTLI